jgi:hypothetical protein
MQQQNIQQDGLAGLLATNPFVGFLPWIAFMIIAGPSTFELAAGVALALAVALAVAGLALGIGLKLLDVAGILFFAVLVLAGAVGGTDLRATLEDSAGALSSFALGVVALGSLALGHPFTLDYAKQSTPRQYWDSPRFLQTNQVLTAVWGGVFLASGIMSWAGEQWAGDNVWTQWVIPIALVIGALRFTRWYPEQVRAAASERAEGQTAERTAR